MNHYKELDNHPMNVTLTGSYCNYSGISKGMNVYAYPPPFPTLNTKEIENISNWKYSKVY